MERSWWEIVQRRIEAGWDATIRKHADLSGPGATPADPDQGSWEGS